MTPTRLRSVVFGLLVLWSTGAIAQTGTGLTGKYYDTEAFGSLVTTRTDASINFNFGTAIPAGTAITAATTYSVAWSGQIEPQYSELFTFTVTADDGARLWVNDQMIVSRTFYQAPGELRGQIRLKAGQRVNVRLEFIQQTGNAAVKLEWASASQTKQVVPTNRLYTTTEVPNGGSVMREVWHGLAGASIGTLTSNANYPSKPASREFITSFECLAKDWEDSFGTRVTGLIRPAVSGSYTFAVSGDEVVQLFLSTDGNAANKTLIASTTTATAFRDFAANASQQSAPRTLVAGQRYYVELLHKEDTGADHWSVAWKQPGSAAFSVIPGTALMMPGTDTAQPSTANFFNTLATEQPRLGVSRERFLWLKQQYLSPTASNAKTRAQAVINTATGELTATLVTQRAAQDRIQRLALAWWLTGDSQYAEAAWNNINNAITNGAWTDPWKGVENGVIAIGYDWLYPYWSQERKDAMVSCMVNKGFNPGWTGSYDNNIGVIINAGHLMAMLAVGTANEAASENRMGTAISRLTSKIERFNANAGAWYEGTDYGIFTKWNLGQAMPAIECALGSTFGMSKVAGVSNAAREPLTIASNTRQRFTFSDVGTGSEAAIGWANWWARRFNALEVFDYSRQIGNSPLNALTLPETTISPAAAGLNPDTAFRGPVDSTNKLFQEVVTLRENWTDTKATFVGGMGGTYYDHGMLQSGTFQLSARGVKWFVDLSSESYDVPNHNTTTPNPNGRDRWDYYRNRAEGHNCLVINPGSGPDRIWNAPYAPLLQYQSAQNGQRSFAVWDLSKNISGVTKVQRGLQLLSKRRDVLVQDEIVLPAAGTAWWFAHFNNSSTTATISPDGSSVTLQQGSERLWGKIVSGGGIWTVRAALPLPTSPAPPEAYTNATYSKLAINLTGVTNTTLAVWFVPLAPGENPPATTPTLSPLATWNLVAGNEAPIASNGSANTAGVAPVDVALTAYTTDDWTPSAQMTYAVSAAVGGSVSLLPDGLTARFTPTPGFTGSQSFAFTATDADGATSNTGTITFSAPPVITNWTSPSSGNWSVGTNWQSSAAPVGGPGADIQFFNGQTLAAGTITATNNLAGTTDANKLNFSGTGAATSVVNVSGNALRLVRNGILSPAITFSGATTGYRYNIANDIVLNDDVNLNGSGSGTFVLNGAITGNGGITRTGTPSTLILAGNNSYAGATSITAGTLQIGNDGATGTLGNGPVSIASGATLRFDRTGSVLVSNDITGAGRVIVNGATSSDVVSLGGDNDFTGEVRVDNGSLRVTDARQLGIGTKNVIAASSTAVLRINGASGPVIFPSEFSVFTSNPNGAILNEAGDNEISGNLTLSSGAGGTRITVAAGSLTIGGTVTSNFTGRALDLRGAGNGIIHGNVLDGAGANTLSGFSKNDAGTWTLNGNNAITCTTVVSGGKLVVNGSHASGAVSVAAGATLSGRGTLTAATTITGSLAPGDGIGTMNFGSTVSFGSASKLQWELASNSLVADLALATGALSVTNGAKIDIVLNSPGSMVNLLNSFWRTARTFPVVNGSGMTGAFAIGTVTTDAGGRVVSTYGSFTVQNTATGANLVWTPIPGFPIYNDPVVTITSPASQPVSVIDADHELRLAATSDVGPSAPMLWSMISGPEAVNFENPTAANTRVRFAEAGTYILRCTASNAGGSGSRDLTVEVAPVPTELSLREGVNSVAAPATFIRGDTTTWNSGARDQVIVGRTSAPFRALFSFPIPATLNGSLITDASLGLTIAATGSGTALGTLELHRLLTTFAEGIGDGSAATNGAGTGADWPNRSYTPATPWSASGGGAGTDYESANLSTTAGFDPGTVPAGESVVFDTTPAFISAIAGSTAQSLGLLVKLTGDTSGGTNFARFASDDHATLDWRPELRITHYEHLAPILDPGLAPAAIAGTAVTLTGSATNGTPDGWTYASGPGVLFFLNATSTTATVLFTKPGSHLLRFSGTNTHGESSRTVVLEVTGTAMSELAVWRQTHFGTTANTGTAADLFDANHDGESNLMEFATWQNPNTTSKATPTLALNAATLEFTYTRSLAAMSDGITFTAEWGETLAAGSWSNVGVTEQILSDNGIVQTVRARVAAGTAGRRFVHLKVTNPQ
jgi:autotransporter-associated beta strand protein